MLRYGCGALNIDGCRVPADGEDTGRVRGTLPHSDDAWGNGKLTHTEGNPLGRWPANLLHDGSAEVLDAFAEFGESKSVGGYRGAGERGNGYGMKADAEKRPTGFGDTGTPARFFMCAKADATDRAGSKHATVKPGALMRWLVKLIVPPGGTVLDPFAGTGSTGLAADQLGMDAVLIEQSAEYAADARRKLTADAGLFARVAAE